MDIEEIKAMIGTEFIYVDEGVTLPALVAAFDPEVGFTCLATNVVDSTGYDHSNELDENGNFCLIGVDRNKCDSYEDFMGKVVPRLLRIRDTGTYTAASNAGNASCSF